VLKSAEKKIPLSFLHTYFFACIFFILSFCLPFPAEAEIHEDSITVKHLRDNLALTKEEQEWLSKHSNIKIGIDAGYPPYSFLDKNKKFIGVAPDFISILAKGLGINFEPVPDLSWPQILQNAKDKELDVVATAVITPERLEFLNFSQVYIPTPLVIMTRHDRENTISSADDLAGKTVALVKGYSSSKRVLQEHPGILQHLVDSPLEGLQAVAAGEAQAYVGVLGVNFYMAQQHGLSNLVIASRYDLKTNGQRFGVRKDWPELRNILDKALDLLSKQDIGHVMSKWIPLSISGATMNSTDAPAIEWTADETEWLSTHPEIKIGIMSAWPPMDYVDDKGQIRGIGTGFISALNKRLNGALKVHPGEWASIYDGVKNKTLDALSGITPRKSREAYFNFTDPYVNVPHAIFKRKGDKFSTDLNSLSGKKVAAEKGFFIHDVIKNKYPQIKSIEYNNTSDAIDAVVKGEADAYIGNRAVAMYIINNELITNLEEHGKIQETSSVNAIGVRKDEPILRDILQKALSNITIKERFQILKNWVEPGHISDNSSIELTTAEWSWLDQHPVIRVAGDSNFAPVEYLTEDGVFKGISVEYLDIISNMLGTRFEYKQSNNWSEATDKLKNLDVDIFSAAASTIDRREYAQFTHPFLSLPVMIFTPENVSYISNLSELEGRKVAVVRDHATTELVRRGGWNIELIEVDTIADGLQAIQDRDAFAYLGNILVTSYSIRQEGHTNIRVSGQTPYRIDISMGVRNDWVILVDILNKALKKIGEKQRNQINASWIGLQFKEAPDYKIFWQALFWGVLVLFLFFFWNRYLQNKNSQQNLEIRLQNDVLNLSRTSFSNAQRIAKLGSWDWPIENTLFYWSKELYRIFGLDETKTEAGYESFIEAIHPEDRSLVDKTLQTAQTDKKTFVIEARVQQPSDDIRHVKIRGEVMLNKDNASIMSGTVLDISERKAAERELQKLFQAFENSPITIMTTDLQGTIEYVNPCFTQTTGYQSEEVIGLNPSILKTGYTSDDEYKEMWDTINSGKVWRGEFRNQRKNGELYWARATIAPVWDEHGKLVNFLELNQDISFQKEIEEKLFEEANYSVLTKQPNRYYMLNRIEQNIHTQTPFALLMVDMVNIKRINDSLGIEAGDKIIKQAALRLDSLVDRFRFVAHFGGGQFVILAEQTHKMVTEVLISNILSCFKQPFDVKEEKIKQNASVGIALYPDDGNTKEELLTNAHVAVNQAKRSGNITYAYFSERFNKEAQKLLQMENLLGQALKNYELSIVCQPKIDVSSGKFLGAEALLRWFNSELGDVPPDQFIPLAEESGLILSIGRWVINESCRQASLWHKAGYENFTIAINLSPKQFLDKDIVPFIENCLHTHSLAGNQVEIEVTEGLFIEGGEAINLQISAMKELGLSLALDDFGTGYSSLQYLRNYPFDTLKIDRSFVSGLPESQSDASLVRAMTAMGRALGMKIVAEGVEQQAQADYLKNEGCDIYQGFLFGKPMSETDFMAWLKNVHL